MNGFDLPEVIRLNQLVRGRIDYEGFCAWYEALSLERRRALTGLLHALADQAGASTDTWEAAWVASGLPDTEVVVQRIWFLRRGKKWQLDEFLQRVPEQDLRTVFRLYVYLFGLAEGAVYRRERKEWCNHWWHRDLLDERVVRDLLTNPRYYTTAMRDDDRIKGGV